MVRRGSTGDSSSNDFSDVGGGSSTDTGSGVTGDSGDDTSFGGGGGTDDDDFGGVGAILLAEAGRRAYPVAAPAYEKRTAGGTG